MPANPKWVGNATTVSPLACELWYQCLLTPCGLVIATAGVSSPSNAATYQCLLTHKRIGKWEELASRQQDLGQKQAAEALGIERDWLTNTTPVPRWAQKLDAYIAAYSTQNKKGPNMNIVLGDITTFKGDAITHIFTNNMNQHILDAAGPELKHYLDNLPEQLDHNSQPTTFPAGAAIPSEGFDLPAKLILHVKTRPNTDPLQLINLFASVYHIKTLAIPASWDEGLIQKQSLLHYPYDGLTVYCQTQDEFDAWNS